MSLWIIVLIGVSIALTTASLFLAWRSITAERQRSDARVSALSAAIDPPGRDDASLLFLHEQSAPTHPLVRAFAGLGTVLGVVLIVTLAIGLVQGPTGAIHSEVGSPEGGTTTPKAPVTEPALELLAMDHRRSTRSLMVTGTVRNGSGQPFDGTAEVVVVDGADRITGRARVFLAQRPLPPGASSSFRMNIPDVVAVDRYRVSFWSHGEIVRHVDRRAGHAGAL